MIKIPNNNQTITWNIPQGCALALAIHQVAEQKQKLQIIITHDIHKASQLTHEIKFFANQKYPVIHFPDWEILPYDWFSPFQDIISERLAILAQLAKLETGVIIIALNTLMQKLAPSSYIGQHSLILKAGETINITNFKEQLVQYGYRVAKQVMEHGEVAIRGSLLDIFPMGSPHPYRIDFFDNEIDSIRAFDIENQTSFEKTNNITLLPTREFPTDEKAIRQFRQTFLETFPQTAAHSLVYKNISVNNLPAGIEIYLPLFFKETASLFHYLPKNTLIFHWDSIEKDSENFLQQVTKRYLDYQHNPERPLLPPDSLYLSDLNAYLKNYTRIIFTEDNNADYQYPSQDLPQISLDSQNKKPTALKEFLENFNQKVLFTSFSAGRREDLIEQFQAHKITLQAVQDWQAFIDKKSGCYIAISEIEKGSLLDDMAIITENDLAGQWIPQKKMRKGKTRDADAIIRNLTDLHIGDPVVHEEHGIGRYRGLQTIELNNNSAEFLTIEYKGGDILYVPIMNLHVINRYTGASNDSAPWHKLGGEQWQKIRKKTTEKLRDVAAELLAIEAQRASKQGYIFTIDQEEYQSFANEFPFEPTVDQQNAIDAILTDMQSTKPMDRLVCGDVGFGKTEVAMRAAFIAAFNQKQVAVLVPTTLLAQQHYENFKDRFANWPLRIEVLSRFNTKKKQTEILAEIEQGNIDIIIGTHKLLQPTIKFQNLGLLIVDEEHRFGVKDKEKLKKLRAEVDLLTLTATPIPRTLNFAMSGLRDFSIIATPPAERHPIKTFLHQWNDHIIQEASWRELQRGGQIYFIHNEVETIEKMAERIKNIIPQANIAIAHGQLREKELEHVMQDFYHQRYNLLLCTTIIESGIDVPNANTIIINRADKFGLAQLHQLRGRVGRSYHRAYAYLITPPEDGLTKDAQKRLDAITALSDPGIGFTLATHDLEIRGTGALLGEEQSGKIEEIGFSLYTELLERTIEAIKQGQDLDNITLEKDHCDIELHIPSFLPDDYIEDVHTRLVLYKRLAAAENEQQIREFQVELIDRFGLLPDAAKNLIKITQLKLKAKALGIKKIETAKDTARITFSNKTTVNPQVLIQFIQENAKFYKFDGESLRYFEKGFEKEKRLEWVEFIIGILQEN